MRQTLPTDYQYDESIAHPITFKNQDGNVVEISIVTSNIIRVRHLVGGIGGAGAEQQRTEEGGGTFSVKQADGTMEIQTPSVRVVIELPTLRLVWYDVNDPTTPFAEDLKQRAYAYDKHGDIHWHYRRKYSDDLYYGLGERTGNLNLAGRRFRLERLDSMGYDAETQDPLYKFCPYYVTLSHTTRRAHGIFYQNLGATTVDFGQEFDAMWGAYTYYQTEAGPLDYFVIYGPSVPEVVRNFGTIVGRPRHLPPRYSFGYLASSMAYAEADNAQEQLESFADLCRKHDIPCDGMHLSSGYTVVDCGDRCVFTWNKKRFPDPERLAKRLKQDGIHIFANVKPWLLHQSHPDFEQVKKDKGLVWDPENDRPSTVWQWRGGRHTMGKASYIDFTSKAGYTYWQSKLKSELVDKGYDIWLDNNEFTMLDDSHTYACQVHPDTYDMPFFKPRADEEHSPSKIVGTPLQTLLMAQASYDVLRDSLPDQRPFLITRSAVPFCHQLVSQTWSGDNYTEWKTIKYNVSMGVGSALCAMPTGYGHDVGGFGGPKPDPELFVRWVQQGIFWPRFCIHSWNEDGTVTEPWMYPEVLPVIRASIHFRYRLIPYLYSLHVTLCHRSGEPLVRPVLYDYQLDVETHEQQFEFMLGPHMLVAPVIDPGQTTRQVYLPQETAWYHYQTGQYFTGGKSVEVPSKMDDAAAPVFIKAGSIVCLGKVMKSVHDQPDDDRRVQIFPERWEQSSKVERRTLTIIEDDGKSLYHEKGGAYAEVQVWMEADENEIRVGLEIIHDGYFPDYDTVWVTCPISSETRRLVFVDAAEMMRKQVDDDDLCSYVGLSLAQARSKKKAAH